MTLSPRTRQMEANPMPFLISALPLRRIPLSRLAFLPTMPRFLRIWAMMGYLQIPYIIPSRPSYCRTTGLAFAFSDIVTDKKQTEMSKTREKPSGPTPTPLLSFLAGPSCHTNWPSAQRNW
jgi:hypothetical protein